MPIITLRLTDDQLARIDAVVPIARERDRRWQPKYGRGTFMRGAIFVEVRRLEAELSEERQTHERA